MMYYYASSIAVCYWASMLHCLYGLYATFLMLINKPCLGLP